MFNAIFLNFFTLALIIATIYCFVKKKYPYLFVPCMLFLPDFYGFELGGPLPLLTVARIMFLIFYVYVFINKRRSIKDISFKSLSKTSYMLLGYFILRVVSNLYYVTTFSQPVKTLFELIFEQFLLLLAFYLLAPTKDEIIKLVKCIVFAATVIFIAGLFESITFLHPFDALYTVSRVMLNEHRFRFALMRSTVTMGLPVFYGNMCVLVLPLVLYLYSLTKQKKYLVVLFLNIMAMIHSGCRADLFFFVAVLFIYALLVLIKTDRFKEFLLNSGKVMAMMLVFMTLLSIINPFARFFYVTTVKSLLNEVGFEYDLTAGAPDGSIPDVENKYGSESRIVQFTGMYYTLTTNPLFGLGSGAQDRKDVHYFKHGEWYPSQKYDVGYVQIFCDEGIIGFTGYFLLLASFSIMLIKRRKEMSAEAIPLYMFPVTYMMCMLSTANMFSFLMVSIIVCYYTVSKKDASA